eukprot:CAMPEP_0118936594 /NCGR_PEP_ID=MMETSP1169-20130426/19600_1 /TAXON_ID=36882 /ORGANISM="Pyramimonas obovata, Strain CCMP722" /LENGTH=218 /DNA_ID=CAMNT_0006879903 /DNA_START=60 /DNA_END=714 /DNA_ORIENTATION=+
MSFFQRIASYVVNEVLVDTLANSKSFQRFAINSNAKMQELAKKSAEAKKVFNEELAKGMKEAQSQASKQAPGSDSRDTRTTLDASRAEPPLSPRPPNLAPMRALEPPWSGSGELAVSPRHPSLDGVALVELSQYSQRSSLDPGGGLLSWAPNPGEGSAPLGRNYARQWDGPCTRSARCRALVVCAGLAQFWLCFGCFTGFHLVLLVFLIARSGKLRST